MIKINFRLSGLALRASLAATMSLAFVACSSLDDNDHYGDTSTRIENSELSIVTVSSEDYMKSRPDLSRMNKLFADNGIYDELKKKGQLSTMLVVTDDNFTLPEDSVEYITKSHVSDVSMSPANLHDGDRLMMWHGKYVNVTIDEIGQSGQIVDHIKFNNGIVKEVVQTANGYIYVISDMIFTPTSLLDFINGLDDDYSIFRELISSDSIFDRANSKAIGINDVGNTVYDSVFVYSYPHFEEKGFDMNSESLTATMLLFSNAVIDEAMADAHDRLNRWGLERPDSVLLNWIMDVAFFNKRYTVDELQVADNTDVNSIFSKQWRTNAQTLDRSGSVELSNGIVHKVSKLHIPNNVLMYRLKDKFYYYENCTDEQKAEYFKMSNMKFYKCNVDVAAWSPLPGVWPEIEDKVLILKQGEEGTTNGFQLDFTPIKLQENPSGGMQVVPYNIPPGAYRLAFGSKQNQNLTIRISVLVDGNVVAKSDEITLGSSTDYHYDRGAALPDRYPEGYDPTVVRAMGGTSKASNYDTDGGLAINEVVIPDLKGDGSATPIVIRIEGDSWGDQTGFTLCHWCLRPTVNNY